MPSELKSILTLDDDLDISFLITSGLKRRGFDVVGFSDPYLALEDFEKNVSKYNLVISDVRMPGMNGFEFLRKVKEIRPDIKVFLMTSFEISTQEFSNVISTIKVDELISKPISLAKLSLIVEKHINILENLA